MPPDIGPELVVEYADRAGAADEAVAWAIVDDLLAGGLSTTLVFRDLLSAAQALVGQRWQRRDWTVQQEHAATAVTSRIIDRIAAQGPATVPHRGKVLVTVAEGEWHRVAAAMVSHALRLDGWEVEPVPPGTRPGQVASAIHESGPLAVLVSCALPALLPGARRLVVTAQDAGTPCLVGGRAFGSSDRRARRIGADGWASDIVTAAEVVAAHAGFAGPSERLEHASASDYSVVRGELGRLTAALQEVLPQGRDESGNGVLELALWLARSLLAALLCDDRSILDEDVGWVASRIGPAAVTELLAALHDGLPERAPIAREFVAGAA